MVQKIIWLLVASAIFFGQPGHGSDELSNDTNPGPEIQSCKSAKSSGLYQLNCQKCPSPTPVYCEMTVFDGEWIVIQQRLDGSVDFKKNWAGYRSGFGTVGVSTEFWLGLEQIHQITNSGEYELAIELRDDKGKYGYARYSQFRIEGESNQYRMSHLGEFSGTVHDAFTDSKGCKFSTFDRDNDNDNDIKCSNHLFSYTGWWYNECGESALNGSYKRNGFGIGLYWDRFYRDGAYSRLMIREK